MECGTLRFQMELPEIQAAYATWDITSSEMVSYLTNID